MWTFQIVASAFNDAKPLCLPRDLNAGHFLRCMFFLCAGQSPLFMGLKVTYSESITTGLQHGHTA